MSEVSDLSLGPVIQSSGLGKFIPEPRSKLSSTFSRVISAVGGLFQKSAQFPGVDLGYAELLNKQMEMQQQMQLVSLYSNVEKSKHETQMAAVRNIRTS